MTNLNAKIADLNNSIDSLRQTIAIITNPNTKRVLRGELRKLECELGDIHDRLQEVREEMYWG